MTSDDNAGPPVRGRPADPFGTPHDGGDSPPDTSSREIPIGVPDAPDAYEKRKRAAERPDPPESGGDAQIDRGDGGSGT